jgi:hypothetical protein
MNYNELRQLKVSWQFYVNVILSPLCIKNFFYFFVISLSRMIPNISGCIRQHYLWDYIRQLCTQVHSNYKHQLIKFKIYSRLHPSKWSLERHILCQAMSYSENTIKVKFTKIPSIFNRNFVPLFALQIFSIAIILHYATSLLFGLVQSWERWMTFGIVKYSPLMSLFATTNVTCAR